MCKSNDVVPIVTIFPVLNIWREFFSKRLIDEFYFIISEAQKKYSFHFLDMFEFDSKLQLNDFQDTSHLNINGAKKVSKYINDYIMKLENNS